MNENRIGVAEHKHLLPLEKIKGYDVRPGFYGINGATALREGVSFTVCSMEATDVELLLYHRGERKPYAVLPFPVQPRNLIILTIGIIISKTCVSKFVPGKKHRGSPAAHQRYTGIFHHFKTKSANLRIFRFSLRSAVPAPIIIMSVRIVPPIVFIVFSIIGIEVPE